MDAKWLDIEIHHVEEHHAGGQTTLENGAVVHKQCHPKGAAAAEFAKAWAKKAIGEDLLKELDRLEQI